MSSTASMALACDQAIPKLPLPPPGKYEAGLSTTDESSGETDDEGGLGDDDVFSIPRPSTSARPPEILQNRPIAGVQSPSSPVIGGRSSPLAETGAELNGLSLMEKLVRSHSVWYLPHMGRSAAAHLLMGKEPGTFVVRQSSKVGAMALTIRLPLNGDIDIDHYLIETTPLGVKLEGSPNYFPALPLLLEYYCLHGEELQTKLCLPTAIMKCETRRDIQSFALLGQDFWTSELSDPNRSESRASSKLQISQNSSSPLSNSSNLSGHDPSLKQNRSKSSPKQRLQTQNSPCYDAQDVTKVPNLEKVEAKIPQQEPSSTSNLKVGGSNPRPAPSVLAEEIIIKENAQTNGDNTVAYRTDTVDNCGADNEVEQNGELSDRISLSSCTCGPTDVPIRNLHNKRFGMSLNMKQSRSAHSGIGPKPALPVKPVINKPDTTGLERRSESVSEGNGIRRNSRRSPGECSLKNEVPLGFGRNKDPERKSFRLKNWFKKDGKKEEEDGNPGRKWSREMVVPGFSGRVGVVTSQSVSSLLQEQNEAAKLWETPTPGRRRLQTFRPESPANTQSAASSTSRDERSTSTPSDEKSSQSATNSTSRDSKSSALIGQKHLQPARQAPPPPVPPNKPKQPSLLRREKSDLGWVPLGTASFVGQQRRLAETERNGDTSVASGVQRVSPPQSSVEEMRQNRLDAVVNKQRMNSHTEVIARKDGSPHVVRKVSAPSLLPVITMRQKPKPPSRLGLELKKSSKFDPISGNQQGINNGSILSTNSGSRKIEHRLSAPNLADLVGNNNRYLGSIGINNIGNGQKFGRQPAGELHTINEGLAVIPVARRKPMDFDSDAGSVTSSVSTPAPPSGVAPLANPEMMTSSSSTSSASAAGNSEKRFSQSLEDLLSSVGVSGRGGRLPEEVGETNKGLQGKENCRVFNDSETYKRNYKTLPGRKNADKSAKIIGDMEEGKKFFERRFGSERNPAKKKEEPEHRNNLEFRERNALGSASSSFSKGKEQAQQEDNEVRSQTNFQWVQVTNEIKTRQKVATVRPRLDPTRRQSSESARAETPNSGRISQSASSVRSRESQLTNQARALSSRSGDSNYAHLSELAEFVAPVSDQIYSTSPSSVTTGMDDDDAVSVAGTVFNEPWDSSVWENLLDLAHYGDVSKTPSATSRSYVPSRVAKRPISSDKRKDRHLSSATAMTTDDDDDYGSRYGSVTAASVERRNFAKKRALDEPESGPRKEWKENNVPAASASVKPWEEFSTRIPKSSESSSLSTWGSRKSKDTAKMEDRYFAIKEKSTVERISAESEEDKWGLGIAISPPRFRDRNSISSQMKSLGEQRRSQDPGKKIQEYVEKLSEDRENMFGGTLQQFVACTVEGGEMDPTIVIRNVRQFMNGIKNYLVKHGEGHLHELIERERSKLTATEFLNIDAILEGVLHKIVLGPLKPHLYHLMIKENSKNGALQALSDNLAKVRSMSPLELGLKDAQVPGPETMDSIRTNLRKMQHHYSPLKKLDNLLGAVSLAYLEGKKKEEEEKGGQKGKGLPPADDLVRWLVFLLSRCSVVGCEVEGVYMWELLPPQLLNGEASYYLTALFSAVHVLKNPESLPKLAQNLEESAASTLLGMEVASTVNGSMMSIASSNSGSESFVRVAIPDELGGSIQYHTFPAVRQMTTGKLCRMIAHKNGITNPEDYGLYLLVDGFETCLLSTECPDLIRDQFRSAGKAHMFAYKRHEAKIAWPKVAMTPKL